VTRAELLLQTSVLDEVAETVCTSCQQAPTPTGVLTSTCVSVCFGASAIAHRVFLEYRKSNYIALKVHLLRIGHTSQPPCPFVP
jgi:hypothetical protein